MANRGWRHFKIRGALITKALLYLCLLLIGLLYINNPDAISVSKSNSSLLNIGWAMSPDEVIDATKDYSKSTRVIENGEKTVVIQRERITDSGIAGKSLVQYSFKNDRLYSIKISKTIKYWPDFILEQLLYKTVSDYQIESAIKTLVKGKTFRSENIYENKVISLAYDELNNPEYAYVELEAKI